VQIDAHHHEAVSLASRGARRLRFSRTFYRWPAFKELATGGPDDVGNRRTVVPDADKWGSRYQELVQLSSVLGR
jgi:hypothetical protein